METDARLGGSLAAFESLALADGTARPSVALKIYFTKPADTPIAASDAVFIDSLRRTAAAMSETTVVAKPEQADVVLIDERYQYRTWHYADQLGQSSFVRKHASRICVINHDSYARVFLPGLYVSIEKSRPPLIPAIPIPYKWDLWKIPVPDSFDYQPRSLYAFRGTFHTHPVRERICRRLARVGQGSCEELRKAFHSHDSDDQKRYIEEIRGARFSLCPRGLSPSSYRLFESMQLGRCPIVISDDWMAPAGPDWKEFAIFVPESKVRNLSEILASEIDRAEERGRRALDAWNEFFSWPRRWRYFLECVVNLYHQGGPQLEYADMQDIWKRRAFRRKYQWTLYGRARQFISRKYRVFKQRPV